MIRVDFSVFTFHHHVFQVTQHVPTLLVGESTPDATQHMQRAIGPGNRQQQVMDHAGPIVRGFRKPDDGGIQRMTRLDFELPGRFATDHDAFGSLAFDPFLKLGLDVRGGLGSYRFHRVNQFTCREQFLDELPGSLESLFGWLQLLLDHIENGEANSLQIVIGLRLTDDMHDIMNPGSPLVRHFHIQFTRQHDLPDAGFSQPLGGFGLPGQTEADCPAGVNGKQVVAVEIQGREFTVDFSTDVVVGRGQFLPNIVAIQRVHTSTQLPAVILNDRQDTQVLECRGAGRGVISPANLQTCFFNQRIGDQGFCPA